jgi:hypothetical protein
MGLNNRGILVRFPARYWGFFFSMSSRLTLKPNQFTIHLVKEILTPGLKLLRGEADHSSSSAGAKHAMLP